MEGPSQNLVKVTQFYLCKALISGFISFLGMDSLSYPFDDLLLGRMEYSQGGRSEALLCVSSTGALKQLGVCVGEVLACWQQERKDEEDGSPNLVLGSLSKPQP